MSRKLLPALSVWRQLPTAGHLPWLSAKIRLILNYLLEVDQINLLNHFLDKLIKASCTSCKTDSRWLSSSLTLLWVSNPVKKLCQLSQVISN